MLNRTETLEIINAIDRKYMKKEKLSFLSTSETLSVYRKNKLYRMSIHEMLKIINKNAHLLTSERNQFDIIAEYILNKLIKREKPYPDIIDMKEEELAKLRTV